MHVLLYPRQLQAAIRIADILSPSRVEPNGTNFWNMADGEVLFITFRPLVAVYISFRPRLVVLGEYRIVFTESGFIKFNNMNSIYI